MNFTLQFSSYRADSIKYRNSYILCTGLAPDQDQRSVSRDQSWPRGYKTWVHSQTQNKAQWLAACGHVSASSQSLCFILSLRQYSSFITSRPDLGLDCLQRLSAKQKMPLVGKELNTWTNSLHFIKSNVTIVVHIIHYHIFGTLFAATTQILHMQ